MRLAAFLLALMLPLPAQAARRSTCLPMWVEGCCTVCVTAPKLPRGR